VSRFLWNCQLLRHFLPRSVSPSLPLAPPRSFLTQLSPSPVPTPTLTHAPRSAACSNWLSSPVCPAACPRPQQNEVGGRSPGRISMTYIMLSVVLRWRLNSKLVLADPDPFLRLLHSIFFLSISAVEFISPSSSSSSAGRFSIGRILCCRLPFRAVVMAQRERWPSHRRGRPRSLGIGPVSSRSDSLPLVLSLFLGAVCLVIYRRHSS